MFLILGILFIIILIYYKFSNKIKVKWKTFLKKGFKPNRGVFGIYCFCGKQGSGKTVSLAEFIHNNTDMKLYANMKSLKGIRYTYIANFNELLSLSKEHDILIVYDELFSSLQKNSVINKDVLDFLSQMRKRRIICLTTAQEWAEIPLTWRRYCRYQIDCKLISVPLINGILIKVFKDAEHMKWSNDDQEYVAPILETTITHTQKWIADSYDTFEQIHNDPNEKGLYEIFNPMPSKVLKEPLKVEGTKAVAREEIEILDDIDTDFWSEKERRSMQDYE